MSDHQSIVVEGLRAMGIAVDPQSAARGFLNGVRIQDGALLFDPNSALASNLLHEAGHLAVIPERWRALANDDISIVQRRMLEDVDRMIDEDPSLIDSALTRAAMQAGDPEATAWAFAAGRHLGVPDDRNIRDCDYGRTGKAIRVGLSLGSYIGINGLVAGGMCANVRAFPTLTRWLQNPLGPNP